MSKAAAFRLKSPPTLSENDVERACLDLLRVRGYYPARQHVGTFKTSDGRWIRLGERGLPDYMVIHSRHPGFMLEVKRERGGGLSADQRFKIQQLTLGYRLRVAVVASSRELADWLTGHERSP